MLKKALKKALKGSLRRLGYDVLTVPSGRRWTLPGGATVADQELYRPLFSPWEGLAPFESYYQEAEPWTLSSRDRCWVLYSLARQCLGLPGDFAECGVYQGGTALMLARLLRESPGGPGPTLHLFDTFAGMPDTDAARDWHQRGDFADTSVEAVAARLGKPGVQLHPGLVPDTFRAVSDRRFAFAHVDLDIYQGIFGACEFLLPRLITGGVLLFDDYGFPTCPGARKAVDDFFAGTPFVPLVLPTGQAIVFKHLDGAAARP